MLDILADFYKSTGVTELFRFDTELFGVMIPEKETPWIRDQWTKIRSDSDTQKNEGWIDAERRPLVEVVQKTSRLIPQRAVHQSCERKVGEQHTEGDRD